MCMFVFNSVIMGGKAGIRSDNSVLLMPLGSKSKPKNTTGILKEGCTRYLPIVSVLPSVDNGQHAPTVEEQPDVPPQKQSYD